MFHSRARARTPSLKSTELGVDIKFSAKGREVKSYKDKLDEINKIISKEKFYRSKNEMKNKIFRRSIYSIKNIKKGEKFSEKNISTFRPDIGLSASFYPLIIGKKSPNKIDANNVLKKSILKKLPIKYLAHQR